MIFNKSSNGAAELKELIGFIYKSVNFNDLKKYIGFAERYVKKVIGPEVFKVAEDHYKSDHYHWVAPEPAEGQQAETHPEYAILDDLVEKIQYPVAVHAYRMYVPSGDLTHSPKGRQIFVSEEEKPAFEWQIEKDNENLISLANLGTDMLIEFLDANIDTTVGTSPNETNLIPWGTSDAYKAIKELFIPSVDDFEKVFMIGGSRTTYLSLVPFIRRVQVNEIKSCIGPERYDVIMEQVLDKDVDDESQEIFDKICQPLALLALSVAVKRLSAEVLPAGIFTNIVSNVVKGKTPAAKQERNEISSTLERDGLKELLKLQEHIRKLDATDAGETITYDEPGASIDPDQKFVRV
jgi:hypothetical protein